MDPVICLHYLHLLHSRKIPVYIFSRLLAEFATVDALITLPKTRLQTLGFADDQIDVLQNPSAEIDSKPQVDKALEWSVSDQHHLLCFESKHYPGILREIDSAPPLLFVRGSLAALSERQFAMVGSRSASIYGKRNAYWMAQELSKAGLMITSGLAGGIDTKAHEGALSSGGRTIAVIGTGIDRSYPAGNKQLADRIADNGALVSEFPLGTPPYASNFPRRNRLISGMAEGTLVVEATIKSGSLITARLAMEQNRDVFALPGAIGSSGSRGCHHLIKQGAKLVEQPRDILDELGIGDGCTEHEDSKTKDKPIPSSESSLRSAVLEAVDRQGCLFQSILQECRLETQELSSQLIKLEADGLIHQQGGRYFRQG
ncbi:MAG: DNA-processing protein DprA [Pseudohongiellaceae bacterium]